MEIIYFLVFVISFTYFISIRPYFLQTKDSVLIYGKIHSKNNNYYDIEIEYNKTHHRQVIQVKNSNVELSLDSNSMLVRYNPITKQIHPSYPRQYYYFSEFIFVLALLLWVYSIMKLF